MIVAGVVIGAAAGFGGSYALLERHGAEPVLTSAPSLSNPVVTGTVASAAATAMSSTVDIRAQVSQGRVEGSGVILTPDGEVLTNNHVIAGAKGPISVTLADGSQHQADVVGAAPSCDLAVIELRAVSGLRPATLGNSADLRIGQQVVAIGSPEGLTGTVTDGIISAVNRTVTVQTDDGTPVVYNGLQTDAPINPGNSGGPLVDLSGHVVGIDSAIATTASPFGGQNGSIGLGFAIPIDQARRVAQELIDTGTATKPFLGVQGNAGATNPDGAVIAGVQSNSPAAKAGIATGDVVMKVDNARVEDFADLIARVGSHAPGDTVDLAVDTGGATRTVPVTLAGAPDRAATTSTGGQEANPLGPNTPFGLPNPFGGD